MLELLPNLYRFTGQSPRGETLYTYLVVRPDGNLLLPCQDGGVRDHMDDIKRLGGVATQFVTHNHDVDGNLCETVHERFGARLAYHAAEHDAIAKKTTCPADEFGDDGLQVDADFEAIYFPSCCVGSSVYHWQQDGQHRLFTSHVIDHVDGQWRVGLDLWQYRNLRDWGDAATPPDPRPRIATLADLPLDQSLPNVWREGQQEYHTFTDATRTTFAQALRTQIEAESPHVAATAG
jgi:hypothetical protein